MFRPQQSGDMPHAPQQLDITFFGRHCRFSATVLQALIEAGHRVNTVIVPGFAPGSRIMLEPSLKPRLALSAPATLPTVAGLAWNTGAKLVEIGRDDLASLPDRFRELQKGVAISACFPWKLPVAVLETPELRGLNVHPSLLPAHRGPDPVFWTMHAGDIRSGATINLMTADLDAGPVLAQQPFDLPIRSRAADIEAKAVSLGASLLIELLTTIPPDTWSPIAPPRSALTQLEPQPTSEHLHLDTSWSAERAFRFVYGAAPDYGPLTLLRPLATSCASPMPSNSTLDGRSVANRCSQTKACWFNSRAESWR